MKSEIQFDQEARSTQSTRDEEFGDKEKEDGEYAPESQEVKKDHAEDGQGDVPTQQRIDDWDGLDDPENPHNWPMHLRVYHAVMPALFGFAV